MLPVTAKSLQVEGDAKTPTVHIRELSGLERDEWAASIHGQDGKLDPTCRVRLVVYSLCDENGKRIYADNEFDRAASLSAPFVDEVAEASLRFNKLAASDVEETLGNSESGPSAASGSHSQDTSE